MFHIKYFLPYGLTLLLMVFSIGTNGVQAIEASTESSRLTIEHTLASKNPVQDRTFSVQLPEGYYDSENTQYPVLYILDGKENLSFTKSVVDFLSSGGQMPSVIIVGLHSGDTRTADYVPVVTAKNNQRSPSGQANRFLNYIDKELIPFINSNYRTSGYQLLSGHSFGGTFTSYALTQKPELFSGYFAQSPSFVNALGDTMAGHMDAFLGSDIKQEKTYFLTLGSEPALEEGFDKIINLLEVKAPKDLVWHSTRQKGRLHMQTRLIGLYDALEQHFAKDWPLAQAAKAENVQAHINTVSAKYGLEARYDEASFAEETQALFAAGNLGTATEMAAAFARVHPKSPIAHFMLVNAYSRAGEKAKALKEISIARHLIENADVATRTELQPLYGHLGRLEKRFSAE